MFFQSKNKADCCGCGVCSKVCPKNAITMTDDGCGFLYPVINEDMCVHCGLCERACTFDSGVAPRDFETKFYAVRSKSDDVVMKSSSGGMFTLMAEVIFAQRGVVYGVAYGENFRVEHARAENMGEAEAFRTSKYVQSDMQMLYDSVRMDLEAHRVVLVTGTPCQIAALRTWIDYCKVDASGLYLVDNICHGVSSPLTFADYMSALKQYIPKDDQIVSVNMRHKQPHGTKTTLQVKSMQNGPIGEVDRFSYYRFYQNRIGSRLSCFNCKFTSYERCGDLSVADFWNGKNGDFSFDVSQGVNEVLVNTQKGQNLFDAVCENAFFQEVSREKAWQPHLEYAVQKPKNYEKFWAEYHSAQNREDVIRKYSQERSFLKAINFIMPVLRKTGLYSFCGKLYRMVFVRKGT